MNAALAGWLARARPYLFLSIALVVSVVGGLAGTALWHHLPDAPAGPAITLPESIEGGPPWLDLQAQTAGKVVCWHVCPTTTGNPVIRPASGDSRQATFGAAAPGLYHVFAWTAVKNTPSPAAHCIVRWASPGPVPPGPNPPVPPVPPVPPQPPAPIPDAGLRVLMVYETADSIPPPQRMVMQSQTVRDWLNAHCAKGPDNKTAEWRIWDQNVDTAGESPLWQAAMKRPRAKVPWLLISNGKTGFEGPLPGTVDETMKLLQQYGG